MSEQIVWKVSGNFIKYYYYQVSLFLSKKRKSLEENFRRRNSQTSKLSLSRGEIKIKLAFHLKFIDPVQNFAGSIEKRWIAFDGGLR